MINPDAPSDSSEVPPEITLPSNILGRFGNTTEDKTAQPAGSCHTPASEPPKTSSNAPPKQADSTGGKTGLDWAAPFLADPAQQSRTTNSSEANRSAKPVESLPRNRYDSTATAAPTVNSHASRPSNGRIYNHGNGTEASILGNRKPFSVKFRDEPAPERPNHERATSDDIVTFKPAQQADSMYSRMSEKDWNRSEASVNTHTNRTNGTYTHSNEALVKGEDGKTQKKNDSKKPTLKQRINDLWTEIMMVGSWLLALLFAIGHHLFFSHIDTTLAGSAQSQFWVRNAGNAFAHFAVIFLGIAVSTSLIQALMGIRLKTVDNMFSLPSPKAIKELLKGIKFKHALYLLLIVILMKGLILVSILAPNSLTIGFAESTPVALVVPSLSFGAPLYSAHVAVWDDMVNQAIVTPPEDDWDVPAGCGTECSFDVEYQAPALSCQDLSATEFTLVPYESANTTESGVQWTYYQTLSTSTQTQWNGQNNSPFLCNYKPMTLREVSGDYRVNYTLPHVGASCFCQDATYRTTFKFANNRKTVETNLVSYGGSSDCAWSDPSSLSPECQNYATNSLQICKSFMHSFSGAIEWRANHTEINVPSPLVLDKIVLLDSDINGDGIVSLTPRFTNLSQGLVSMFANMTANLVPGLAGNSTTNEVAWDGAGIWDYSAVTLWAIYSPVFLSSLVILFYAFYCIHKNGRALDNKFTTLILVAQTEAMDDINEIAAQHSDEQTEKENDPEKGDGYFELNNL
ncbi:hypothetical protein CPB86DRAFT_183920 [Serendipita vermifera]|nr:hypothetical protein CPB86DRAFT_183920 [Serendipita vermifera]